MKFISKFFQNNNMKFQITLRYIVALFIVACMSVISNRITDRMISEQEKYSEIINVSGRQRMLTQRVFYLCYYLSKNKNDSLYNNQVGNEIIKLSSTISETNIFLDKKRNDLNMFKESDSKFHDKIQYFAKRASDCAKTKNCQQFVTEFNDKNITELISNLNNNVEKFSNDSKVKINSILDFSKFILILTLFILFIEAFFVFKPMVKRISSQFKELENKNRIIFETNTKLELEMNAARLAMGNLLPKIEFVNNFDSNLDISYYYQSSASVGGDLWGVYKCGNKKLIIIGDVTGHGAGSAVIASAVTGFIESLSSSKLETVDELRKIYKSLSNFINRIGNNSFYMTMAMLVFDDDLKHFSFVNAAHNFPFLVEYTEMDNCVVKRLVLGGLRLGNKIDESEEVEIKINNYEFNENTILILFTDGLTENMNHEGNEYGEVRIKKLVKNKNYRNFESSVLIKDIIDDAYKFYNRNMIEDDITLVVIKMPIKS